jgi:hypothetical protein
MFGEELRALKNIDQSSSTFEILFWPCRVLKLCKDHKNAWPLNLCKLWWNLRRYNSKSWWSQKHKKETNVEAWWSQTQITNTRSCWQAPCNGISMLTSYNLTNKKLAEKWKHNQMLPNVLKLSFKTFNFSRWYVMIFSINEIWIELCKIVGI